MTKIFTRHWWLSRCWTGPWKRPTHSRLPAPPQAPPLAPVGQQPASAPTPAARGGFGNAAVQPTLTPLERKIKFAREFVEQLVQRRANGITSRGELASRLGWPTRDLSNFMTGKAPKKGKTLDRTTLGTRAACLLSDLKCCGFTAPPPAAPQQAPAAQSPAAEPPPPAARPAPPKPTPQPPVAGLRRTSIFEANLTEVEGAQEGGTVHVLDLGESVPDDARWQMPCPRTRDAQRLTLRLGFHASRTVVRGALAGRTFDSGSSASTRRMSSACMAGHSGWAAS